MSSPRDITDQLNRRPPPKPVARRRPAPTARPAGHRERALRLDPFALVVFILFTLALVSQLGLMALFL